MWNQRLDSETTSRSYLETLSGERFWKRRGRSLIRLLLGDDGGQVLPWVAVASVVLVSTAALVLDLGNAMVAQRELQTSTDAAALAAVESISGASTAYQGIAKNYGAASGENNVYSNMTVATPTVTPLCLKTVSNWGIVCKATGSTVTIPNAVQVTETATVRTFFAGIFGKSTLSLSATSTAANARPMPYNIALIVDSTLSMNATDSNCGGATQENCALQGVRALLAHLNPDYDYVSLFTFPNVAAASATSGDGSSAGVAIDSSGAATTYNCTTAVPSSYDGVAYSSSGGDYAPLLLLPTTKNGKVTSTYQPPYDGVAWAMPYSFPPVPTTTGGYTIPTGAEAPTYQVVGFSSDYQTSTDGTVSLNTGSNLVKAAGGVSGCGGLAPSSYDGNYGTYYAGALYAAQAALLHEQTLHANSSNVIIVLGDGNSTAPDSTTEQKYFAGSKINYNTPGMPTSQTQATSTYGSATALNTSAYTVPASYTAIANSNGTYPSYVGECGQAVTAAQYAATYKGNNTLVFTIAYGALATSQARSQSNPNGNCGTDAGVSGPYQNITPCQTLQEMATQVSGEAISDYFYSDYAAQGGDENCTANSNNGGTVAISDIYNQIAGRLASARLIPNDTQ